MKARIRLSLALFCLSLPAAADVTVASPDGKVRFVLSSSAQTHLQYTVTFNSKNIIEPSPVGIVVDGADLADGAQIGTADSYRVNETYPWYGPHSTAVDNCNGAKVALTHPKTKTSYTLEVRAYNDGVAFRHLVPGQSARTPDEATVFRVPAGSVIAPQNYVSGYEGLYPWRTTGNTIEGMMDGEWTNPPFTFVLRDKSAYASITEGALVNYSGMVFQSDLSSVLHARLGHAEPASYGFRSRYAKDIERLSHPAVINGPITTPWRIVMIGADLNALVNCDIVHNVAPPPDPKLFPNGLKTDWIKPGRAVWSYLDGMNSTVEGQKEMVRLGAQLGFEYIVLEGFWRSSWSEAQLKDFVDYARERGVKAFGWYIRSAIQDPKVLQQNLDLCTRVGLAGLKIDFFDHENKEVVDLYEMFAKAAAERKLLVDFHGANKPTGLERTYPNIVGIEGIRGMEFFPPYAQHDVVLPFTRMLAGMGDYRTKVSVALRTGNKRGGNSWTARQVVAALRNPVHIGMPRDGDGARLGCHEAIIGDAVFARVAELLDGRRTRRPGAFVYGPIWPLKRKITCGTRGRSPCGYQIAAGTIESAVADVLPRAHRDELDSHRIRTHVESVLYDNETWTVTTRLVPQNDKTVAVPLGPPDEFSNSGSQ